MAGAATVPRFDRAIRLACIANGVLYFVAAWGLYSRAPWATSLWPWPDVGMSYVFLASIAAAIGAPSIWVGVTGELAAFAGIGLNTVAVNAGAAIYFSGRALGGESGLAVAIIVCAAFVVIGGLVYAWARRLPARDRRAMPSVVRWAFVGFALTLLAVGSALVLQVPRVFPWDLRPQTSTLFGLIFLGAAVYFVHGVLNPLWAFGAGQLWSFLAYDLVLFAPYLRMLFSGSPVSGSAYDDYGGAAGQVNMVSLTVYLSVLGVSTVLALYMAFVHPATRIVGARTAQRG